jgi:hypothetical protein
MSPEVTEIVSALAKISTPVWDAFVFQTRLWGIMKLIFGIAFLIAGFIMLTKFNSMVEVERNQDGDLTSRDGLAIGVVIFWLVGILLLFTGLFNLVNPTYYAVQTLIGR